MKPSKGIIPIVIVGFFVFLTGCATFEKGGGERVRLKELRIKPLPESEWTARKQLLDVVATVGQYNLVSMMLNTFGVQLEDPKKPRFPDKQR